MNGWGGVQVRLSAAQGHSYKYALVGRGTSEGRLIGVRVLAPRPGGNQAGLAAQVPSATRDSGVAAFARVELAGLGSVVQAG